MSFQLLNRSDINDILDYLGLMVREPTLWYLNRLITAYICKVPWESVSRIVKRHTTAATDSCPRYPEEFWHDAMGSGLGGTCFESNLAFFSLLTALGYRGYLTVNDMGASRACHAATVLVLDGRKYLVDITIPLHRAVHFDPHRVTRRRTDFHDYTIRPENGNTYAVERSHHPNGNAFTLIDVPVSLSEYRDIVERDYTEQGHFLKSVVIAKVIDDKVWRFFSDHKPYRLENFNRAGKNEVILSPTTLASTLAERFRMPEGKILAALLWIQDPLRHLDHLRVAGPLFHSEEAPC